MGNNLHHKFLVLQALLKLLRHIVEKALMKLDKMAVEAFELNVFSDHLEEEGLFLNISFYQVWVLNWFCFWKLGLI